MDNKFEKQKGVFKALNIITAIAIICTVCVILVFLLVFGTIKIFDGEFTVSTDGILGFFLDAFQSGEKNINGNDLALSSAPSIIGLFCLLFNLCFLKSYFKKTLKIGAYDAALKKSRFTAISVTCFIWAIVPRIITEYAARTVDSEFFTISQWNFIPYLLFAIAACSFALQAHQDEKHEDDSSDNKENNEEKII